MSPRKAKPIQIYPTLSEKEAIECCAEDEKRSLSNMLLFAFKRYVEQKTNGGED